MENLYYVILRIDEAFLLKTKGSFYKLLRSFYCGRFNVLKNYAKKHFLSFLYN